MTTTHREILTESAISAIIAEGYAISVASPQARAYTTKSSLADLVTSVDLAVQERLVAALTVLTPDAAFLTEEGPVPQNVDGLVWVIDPLDGITNFAHALPHCAISVALYDSFQPVLGIIHQPFSGLTYHGSVSLGAFVRSPSGSDRPLHVSSVSTLTQALASFGLPYDSRLSDQAFAAARTIFDVSKDLRRSGSPALDLAWLSDGIFDLHVEALLHPRDAAAGAIILELAGGTLSDWHGDPVNWLTHQAGAPVLASNTLLHPELLGLLSALN